MVLLDVSDRFEVDHGPNGGHRKCLELDPWPGDRGKGILDVFWCYFMNWIEYIVGLLALLEDLSLCAMRNEKLTTLAKAKLVYTVGWGLWPSSFGESMTGAKSLYNEA